MKFKTKQDFEKLSAEGGCNHVFLVFRNSSPDFWRWEFVFSRFLSNLNDWEFYKGNPLPFDIWFYQIDRKEKEIVGWFKKREIEVVKSTYYGVLVFREKISDETRNILNAIAFGITCRFFGR